jgi:anti-sigma regulatory factor (Ser/Thr protein kinase)
LALPELGLCIPIDAARLEESRREVRLFLQIHGVDGQTVEDVVLCVHEACANSVEHSLSRTGIDVELCVGPASVSVVVADKGLGIDLGLCDLHRRPGLLEPGGRGFYVMARLMDQFEVHVDGGTVIRMNRPFPHVPASDSGALSSSVCTEQLADVLGDTDVSRITGVADPEDSRPSHALCAGGPQRRSLVFLCIYHAGEE